MNRINMKNMNILTVMLLALLAISPSVYGTGSSLNTIASPSVADDAPISITDMRTEGVSQPMGVEEAAPRFSWRYEAVKNAVRGFKQVACRVLVATSPDKLDQNQADMWDSGRKEESGTLSFIYAGKPLKSTNRYYWKVIGFDNSGKSYVSKTQFFEMGLMKGEDWKSAQWIGARNFRPKTLAVNLQALTDYNFSLRFRILEGAMSVHYRTPYVEGKHYEIEIRPGTPGTLMVSRTGENSKMEVLKSYSLSTNIDINSWYELAVAVKGTNFSFRVNGQVLADMPLSDNTIKSGTVALGTKAYNGKKGLVQFDDFKLNVDGAPLIEENFDDSVLFAFQEFFMSNNSYSVVKAGTLEVKGVTYLEPKRDLDAPRFRKSFKAVQNNPTRARAYIAGLGYQTSWLNGKRLDDYLLHPGFARYNKTAYYTVYDITDKIQNNNVIACELGRGWYGMTTPTLWGETFLNDWMAEPALRVLITIDYADGTHQTVVSDTTFKTAAGPILFESIKAGEIYDARKELAGWNTIRYNYKSWKSCVLAKGNMPSSAPGLTAQLFEPIRVVEECLPVSIVKIEDENNAWMIDYGKTMAGNVKLKLKAKAGQQIRMQYLEGIVFRNGREKYNNFSAQATGSFQRDIFIAKGDKEESFEASYSYKGFRYVRVEGLTEQPKPEQFIARVCNSDMVHVGEFKSSSELWNKIWEAGRRSIQGNMQSIPTDCPQWEKLGWTCDDAGPYYAMAFNYDLRKLYEKRLQDYADDISPDGRIRNVVPSAWGKGEDPAWVGSYVNIAWKYYQTYGDLRLMQKHYDNLKLYMETLIQEGKSSEKPPLLTKPRKALGDWVSPDGNTPPEGALIYFDCYFYRYLCMMADIATLLNRQEDKRYYESLSVDLKKQFNEHFYDKTVGCYYSTNRSAGYRQSPQAITLAFGLVPDEYKKTVVSNLVKDIQKRNGHLWAGILGVEAIADALCDNGETDVAYGIHLKDDYPSLGNMIREGATTLWEDMTIKKARSLNHKMYATPLGWMARYVSGLQVDGVMGDGPGFRNVVIKPYVSPTQLQFVEFAYDSPMGRYSSNWHVKSDGVVYDIVIPANASATVRLPLLGKTLVSVSESGKEIWKEGKQIGEVAGSKDLHIEQQEFVIALGSGTYSLYLKTN